MNREIVVGYDGSTHADEALVWAARAARRRHAPLRIVHVARTFLDGYVIADRPSDLTAQVGGQVLADGIERLRAIDPDLEVTTQLEPQDSVAAVLTEASRNAGLLVVGSRGRGGFAGLLLGSVSVTVASHAHCPVVVVRTNPATAGEPGRPVVVGVDGSPASEGAISFAFEAASLRHAPLTAVHCWTDPAGMGPVPAYTAVLGDPDPTEEFERSLLGERLAGWGEKYPDVTVERVLSRQGAAFALGDLASTAQLLVIGTRGHAGLAGLLAGSTGQTLIGHSSVPVVVVRPPR